MKRFNTLAVAVISALAFSSAASAAVVVTGAKASPDPNALALHDTTFSTVSEQVLNPASYTDHGLTTTVHSSFSSNVQINGSTLAPTHSVASSDFHGYIGFTSAVPGQDFSGIFIDAAQFAINNNLIIDLFWRTLNDDGTTSTGLFSGANSLAFNQPAYYSFTATGGTFKELDVSANAFLNQSAFDSSGSLANVLAITEANGFLSNVVGPTTSVPEPATWALMLIGFGTMGAALRHRRVLQVSA